MTGRKSSDPYEQGSPEHIAELYRIKENLANDLGAASDALRSTTDELAAANAAKDLIAAERDVLLAELISAREFIRIELPHRPTLTHLDKVISDALPPFNVSDLPWFQNVLNESRASLEAAYDQNPENVPTWYRRHREAEIVAAATARLEAVYEAAPGAATAWYREHRADRDSASETSA